MATPGRNGLKTKNIGLIEIWSSISGDYLLAKHCQGNARFTAAEVRESVHYPGIS